MQGRMELVYAWIEKRSPKQQLYLFFFILLLLYLIFYLFLYRPVTSQKLDVANNINTLQTQKTAIQQQIDTLNRLSQDTEFLQMVSNQKKLKENLQVLQDKLLVLKPKLLSTDDIPNVMRSIIKVATNTIDFVTLEEFPATAWVTENVDKGTFVGLINDNLYNYAFRLEFYSTYFSTVEFLKKVENMHLPLYWDKMIYRVTDYPKADVVLEFHVLSLLKS